MIQRAALYSFVLCLVAACSSSPSSSSSSSGSSTAGQQCGKIMNAFCTHAVNDCHLAGTVADCVNQGTSACCQSKCNSTALSTDASIDTCASAMSTLSCTDVNAGNAPTVCKGAVKVPASFTPVIDQGSVGARLSSVAEELAPAL